MEQEHIEKLNANLEQLHKTFSIMRRDLQYQTFRLNIGSGNTQCVQKQHCFVDAIHNPNATPTTVTLTDNGQTYWSKQMAPGDTEPLYGLPFMHDCSVVTDGNSVTIHGRIKG